ncbi:MAG TPA: GrpB family protein [Caulobacteraceae bacterium]
MSEPVVIVDYDPEWPGRYEALRAPLAAVVGELAAEIVHVGSTSVPGLAAKPTIDLNILLRARADLPAVIERLARLGYAHEGDFGIVGREAFATPPGYGVHDHHLYVCAPDWPGHTDQIAFRDYLRAHPRAARAYARLKRSLAVRHRDNRGAYANAKAGFVAAVLKRARRATG